MFIGNKFFKYRVFSMADGGEGGEGGSGGGEQTFTKEQMAAEIARAVDEQTTGLKTKNQEILDKLKTSQDSLSAFEGIDATEMKTMLKTFSDNEELKLISEGKHEEVINKRLEKERAVTNSQIENLTSERDTLLSGSNKKDDLIRDLIIDTSITAEFVKQGGIPEAIDDVVLRAKQVFVLEADGDSFNAVPRKNGEIISGKDGQLTNAEWIESLKTSAPHLFPNSSGSGQPPSGGDKNSIDSKLKAAAAAGDQAEYRRLKDLQKEQKKA